MTKTWNEIKNDPDKLAIYRYGIKIGVWWFARWKDGKQVVGIHEYPIEKVYKDIDNGEYDE